MGVHNKASSAVAHKLQNDLAIIMGECDLLHDAFKEAPAAAGRLDVIKITARRMADTIKAADWPTTLPLEKIKKQSHRPAH